MRRGRSELFILSLSTATLGPVSEGYIADRIVFSAPHAIPWRSACQGRHGCPSMGGRPGDLRRTLAFKPAGVDIDEHACETRRRDISGESIFRASCGLCVSLLSKHSAK